MITVTTCPGDASCLVQVSANIYQRDTSMSCLHHCQLQHCPNYPVCNKSLPKWVIQCRGRCLDCDMYIYGDLKFKSNIQRETCPSCSSNSATVELVQLPGCEHYVCVPCFKKMSKISDSVNEAVILEADTTVSAGWSDNMDEEDDQDWDTNNIKCPVCKKGHLPPYLRNM